MKNALFTLLFVLMQQQLPAQVVPCPLNLKVGNSWTYLEEVWDTEERYKCTIVDSNVIKNDKAYFKVQYHNPKFNPSYFYVRYDSTDRFFKRFDSYEYFDNGEFFYFKKDLRKGDYWKQKQKPGYLPYYYHTVVDTGLAYAFGKVCKLYYIESSDSASVIRAGWWTEEFGAVKYGGEGYLDYLMGCVIDGVVYGDTILVGVGKVNIYKERNYTLSQNYPNPFNPSTTIRYQIPQAGKVLLRVYDVLGREVATLVDEYKEQGSYEAVFNASGFPGGNYICNIRINDYTSAIIMTFLK